MICETSIVGSIAGRIAASKPVHILRLCSTWAGLESVDEIVEVADTASEINTLQERYHATHNMDGTYGELNTHTEELSPPASLQTLVSKGGRLECGGWKTRLYFCDRVYVCDAADVSYYRANDNRKARAWQDVELRYIRAAYMLACG